MYSPIFKNTLPFFAVICALSVGVANASAGNYSIAKISGVPVADSKGLEKFYQERNGKFLWVDGNSLSSDTKKIVEDISKSWEHGLNPANYRYSALKELLKNGVQKDRALESEMLVADAVIRYGQDVSGMRLSPKTLEEDSQSWSRGIDGYALLKILAEKSEPAEFIQQLLPQDDEYKKLSKDLKEIAKDLSKNEAGDSKPLKYSGLIRPGERDPAIVHIRKRLGVEGTTDVYDDKLKKAVKEFQSRHGLAADGVIGQRSFDAINQTHKQKLVKLIANLERRRWVRRPFPSRYVVVNIPHMHLKAYDKGEVAFEMPVIIGRTERPTNSFVDNIIGVRFNPRWFVPDTIKNEDFLPALKKNPHALDKKNIQFRKLTDKGFKKVDPSEISWKTMTEEGLKSIQMFQDSGDENALGSIRVLMPNKYDIYLHDTNAPQLFSKNDRALSSGCVRMSEPRRMANFILGNNFGWTNKKLEDLIEKEKLVEVRADVPVPVYLLYYTAWVDAQGKTIITNDVYGQDVKLVSALQKAGKIPFELGAIR